MKLDVSPLPKPLALWRAPLPCDSQECVELLATVVLTLVLAPAPIEVPEPTVQPPPEAWLQWDAPDSCPAAEYLDEATAARLGRPPEPGEVTAKATVEDRGAEGLALTLETTRDARPTATRCPHTTASPWRTRRR